MQNRNEKADVDYAMILIAVMFWIVPLYEFLMKC
jgi:hypothetical protein